MLDHVADRHDPDQAALIDHGKVAEFSLRHPLHEAGDRLALSAGRDLARHRDAYRFVERRSAAFGHGADDVPLRKNTNDAMIGAENEHRTDALFCQQRHGRFQGRARFRSGNLTALGRENNTDGHRTLPRPRFAGYLRRPATARLMKVMFLACVRFRKIPAAATLRRTRRAAKMLSRSELNAWLSGRFHWRPRRIESGE